MEDEKVDLIGLSMDFGHWGYYLNGHQKNIIWQIIDESEDKVLLLSRYLLDRVPYHKTTDNVTWETSFMRMWLNNNFFDNAFNKEEQQVIRLTTIKSEENPKFPQTYQGNDTQDKIFLLSIDEAIKYKWFAQTEPFDLALSSNLYYFEKNKVKDWKEVDIWDGFYPWWMRTSGIRNTCTTCGIQEAPDFEHEEHHTINVGGLDVSELCFIRPAMWVDLSYCHQEVANQNAKAFDKFKQRMELNKKNENFMQ